MTLKELRDELAEEVASILDGRFTISITATNTVPQPDDPAITFPNLDSQTQGAKLITTCVLYIDMRKSTDLSFAHKPQTVAKLYSAFVRAMTRTARQYRGHVRGIIGDRVMILFDADNCFADAVHCAIALNTVSQYMINKHFKANEVRFGIGIDFGRMLVTKAGIRRHGSEQGNYRNLVWLGRPANVASKLTDAANKPAEFESVQRVSVAYDTPKPLGSFGLAALGTMGLETPAIGALTDVAGLFGSGLASFGLRGVIASPSNVLNTGSSEWTWQNETMSAFLSQLEVKYNPSRISHKNPSFGSFYLWDEQVTTKEATPSILMTAAVWSGFKKADPNSASVTQSLFARKTITVPGYTGAVFGGNVIYPQLKT